MQGTGGERGGRIPLALFLFQAADGKGNLLQIREDLFGLLLVFDGELGQPLAVTTVQLGGQLTVCSIFQQSLDTPVLARFEDFDFIFSFTDHAQGDRLDTAGRKPVADLFPEERREVKTDQVIKNRAGLLSINHIPGDGARMGHRFIDRRFGDFMESDPHDLRLSGLLINPESFQQMPGDRFSFAVEVSCEDQFITLGDLFFQDADMLGTFRQNMISGRKVVFDINRALLAWQRPHMTVRGQHLVALAQKFFDSFCFRR